MLQFLRNLFGSTESVSVNIISFGPDGVQLMATEGIKGLISTTKDIIEGHQKQIDRRQIDLGVLNTLLNYHEQK